MSEQNENINKEKEIIKRSQTNSGAEICNNWNEKCNKGIQQQVWTRKKRGLAKLKIRHWKLPSLRKRKKEWRKMKRAWGTYGTSSSVPNTHYRNPTGEDREKGAAKNLKK